jgi:hypothetical protein
VIVAFVPVETGSAAELSSQIAIPASSVETSADIGIRAHTNVGIVLPMGLAPTKIDGETLTAGGPPVAGMYAETPASLACVYHLAESLISGCNPDYTTLAPSGGSRAIALVDAYDDPTAVADLAVFSVQFGLPTADLTVVYASGL